MTTTVNRHTVPGPLRPALRWAVTPGLLAFMASPTVRRDPHRLYRAIQRLEPVHHSPFGLWFLSGHEDVSAALRHPNLGSDEHAADVAQLKMLIRLTKLMSRGRPTTDQQSSMMRFVADAMLFRDPPDHTRLRSLVGRAFNPRMAEALAPTIEGVIDELLDPLVPKGHMDVLSEFAYPLPARIICSLFGVPEADHGLFTSHAPALAAGLDPAPMRTHEAALEADRAVDVLSGYLRGLIGERRREPAEDLISGLVAAEEAGDRLSEDELVATCLLLLMAGHETTANLLGNGLFTLLRRPDQLRQLREDPGLDRSAIEELLRYDGPVHMVQRIALDDLEIAGHRIRKGAIVVPLIAAANRDPRVFANPGVLDLARNPNPHVAFGGGAHFCIGAPLARVEARLALRALLDRLPGLRRADSRAQWRPSFTIHGLKSLPVAW